MKDRTNCFRPSAVPLVTVDPYFSIWLFTEDLTSDYTRHWAGKRHGMCGLLKIDGITYSFLGKASVDETVYTRRPLSMKQTELRVTPTSTYCSAEAAGVEIKFTFTSPLLLDRPEIMSSPVTYLDYSIECIDGKEHEIEFYFDISPECVVSDLSNKVIYRKTPWGVSCGRSEQDPLHYSGDRKTMDWGFLHLAHPEADVMDVTERANFIGKFFPRQGGEHWYGVPEQASNLLSLCIRTKARQGVITLAYDDIVSAKYFDEVLPAYYTTFFGSFETMLENAVNNYQEYRRLADKFSESLMSEMMKYGEKYAEVGALLYRQAVASHKLVMSNKDGIIFLSDECNSGGFVATLDVTYPSIPLFLLYNPELVKGMLRPILRYAKMPEWPFEFAPHDVGYYPICAGQLYEAKNGRQNPDMQMPIEECGNAILTTAGICRAEGKKDFAYEHKEQLLAWTEYLCRYGYDPENQLCTDDFAGHLAHNCNLSVKAIVAIAAAGQLFDEPKYTELAQKMANDWCRDAKRDGVGSRLAFNDPDGWSLKYNLVWDKLLGLSLFPEEVFTEEIEVYKGKMNRYGVPLDCRDSYTKLDWQVWTTVLTDDKEYFDCVIRAVRDAVCETLDRVPVTDWYDTLTADQCSFQNRTVVGGYFIPLLRDRFLND